MSLAQNVTALPQPLGGNYEVARFNVHSAAPFYSVLIRVDPNNPSSTTDFVCDLCAAVPQPTDNGRTYTFKTRLLSAKFAMAFLRSASCSSLSRIRCSSFFDVIDRGGENQQIGNQPMDVPPQSAFKKATRSAFCWAVKPMSKR
jgi:hypothetical protein